ncbi:MAG: hypothetical protein H0V14_11740, partial [Chitinophagaceae bacterium]|nr:hypothetical protein [Chitinophagaceae bacterium]
MSDKQFHITTPLTTLLTMLKSEGFDISTATLIDIQKVLANLGDEELVNFTELRSLLGPLICRNKEEQEHFNTIFDKYETLVKESIQKHPSSPSQTLPSSTQQLKWKVIIAGIACVIILGLYLWWKNNHDKSIINIITVATDSTGTILINEPVTFRADLKDTSRSKNYKVSFKIDDIVFANTREVKKTFSEPGSHQLTAWLLKPNGDTLNHFENKDLQVLCEMPPSVNIIKEATGQNRISAGTRYIAQVNNPSEHSDQYKYKWYINDSLAGQLSSFSTSYKSNEPYTINVNIDAGDLHCSTDSLTASLNEMPAYKLSVTGTEPLSPTATLNWKKIGLAGLYSLVLPASLAAIILYYRRRKQPGQKEKPVIDEPKEYTGPYKIEFKKQEDKITPEKEISQLAEAMRKRHVNDQLVLNVKKTIQKTIRSGGFPLLHFSAKTQPTDFLVFTDKENSEGHQVKLFEYIIKKLQNEQVNITGYSFYKEPLLLSNEKLNHSMLPVEKVARLYPNTILFILSNTSAFFQSLNTKLKPWAIEKFKSWEHKIILTPIPVNDWDYKETALMNAGFTVVPADLNAHSLITNEINNLVNRQKLKNISLPASYSSRFVDFEDWDQLKQYLDHDQRLLQWICTLAIYPHIDWKVTVALGKALEEKSEDKIKLVTYSNLLKFSRIKWMQTGLQSDALRLKMLQHLNNESEAIARDTMVHLLNEVEAAVSETSLIKDEFEMNKTVNKFLLHTRDPYHY